MYYFGLAAAASRILYLLSALSKYLLNADKSKDER
jgi:hypothetical protein